MPTVSSPAAQRKIKPELRRLLEWLVDGRQHLNACWWGKCRSRSCENTRHVGAAVVWSFGISQVFHLVSCVDTERYAELESETDGALMGWMCEDPVTVLKSGSCCMSSLFFCCINMLCFVILFVIGLDVKVIVLVRWPSTLPLCGEAARDAEQDVF